MQDPKICEILCLCSKCKHLIRQDYYCEKCGSNKCYKGGIRECKKYCKKDK